MRCIFNFSLLLINAAAFAPSAQNTKQLPRSTALGMYFDFKDDPIIIPQEKYDNLLAWAFEYEPIKPPLAISDSQIGHGHGLFASQPIPANAVAFTVPVNKCLTLQQSKFHPTLGESLEIMESDLGETEGPIAALAAYLASEMLREQCAEWEEDEAMRGEFHCYMDVLPSGRAVSEQDHVLWWSDTEVDSLFEGGLAHDKAVALREWVQAEGLIIESMLVTDLAEKQMGLSISQVRGAVTNAFVNVLSRSLFVGDGEGTQRMVPVLDMSQHHPDPNLDFNFDASGNVVVTALRDIAAGEELTADYYSTEFEGHEFYVMYGFVVPLMSGAVA